MNATRAGQVLRATLTIVGLIIAAMVVIAGLALIATFIIVLTGLGNFGSNK